VSLLDGKVALKDLAITKQLTKDPSDYADRKSLPHVQVKQLFKSRRVGMPSGILYGHTENTLSLVFSGEGGWIWVSFSASPQNQSDDSCMSKDAC
jgi:hypothetical protein